MKLLDDALDRIKPYISEALEVGNPINRTLAYKGPEDYGYYSGKNRTASIARLRLDWELAEDFANDNKDNPKIIADLMLNQMKSDLLELIEDGDTENYNDALLKTIDGSKKRGKEPKNVDIFGAQLFWEHRQKERGNTTEYTLYILMAVQWED